MPKQNVVNEETSRNGAHLSDGPNMQAIAQLIWLPELMHSCAPDKAPTVAAHIVRHDEKSKNELQGLEENEMLELTYHWEGDYLIPDLEPPEAPRIGKYGTMRHNYLRD